MNLKNFQDFLNSTKDNLERLILAVWDFNTWIFYWIGWGIGTSWEWLHKLLASAISLEALIAMAALMIAVLIPVALFLIESTRGSGFKWDQAVIAKRVLNSPRLLFAFFMLSTPLIFWNVQLNLKPLLLVVFILGIVFVTKTLFQAYKWMIVNESGPKETYRTGMRLAYLRSLGANDRAAVWSLTWIKNDSDERALIDERVLIKTFLEQIRDTRATSESSRDMLQIFFDYFDELRLGDPIIYEQLIQFAIKEGEGLISSTPTGVDVTEYSFRHTARRLFFRIMKASMEDDFLSYMFYDQLKKVLSTIETDMQHKLLKVLSANFFPEDPTDGSDTPWEGFPDEWKVTFENLNNENKEVALIWLDAYMRWITSRKLEVSHDEFTIDRAADRATEKLLPRVEPMLWAKMIVLHWSPFGSNADEDFTTSQVRNFIEHSRTFGHMSRPGEFSLVTKEDPNSAEREFEKRESELETEVFNLNKHVNIFPRFRTKESIDEYIQAAKKLKFVDEYEKRDQISLIAMLKQIKETLDS